MHFHVVSGQERTCADGRPPERSARPVRATKRMATDPATLPGLTDVTAIAANTTKDDVRFACSLAKAYVTAAVCVNACWLGAVRKELAGASGILPAATAAFPFGAELTAVKIYSAEQTALSGAREIDMVMNVGAFLSGDADLVRRETELVCSTVDVPVKVIVEAALLGDEELAAAARLVADAGARFVKTNTGLYDKPVTPEQVRIIRDAVGDRAQIKASGGIRTMQTMLALREAGADRFGIGARSAYAIFAEIDRELGRSTPEIS